MIVELLGSPAISGGDELDDRVAAVVGAADQPRARRAGARGSRAAASSASAGERLLGLPGRSPARAPRSSPRRARRRRSGRRAALSSRSRKLGLVGAHVARARPPRSNTSRLASATAQLTGMTAERDAVQERRRSSEERLGEEVATDHRAERRVAAGESLRARDHVGQVVVALAAEHRAEPPERADHLVGHEQHAVPVADLAHALEVALGRHEAAARVLHRLEEHRGDGLGPFEEDRAPRSRR